MTNSTWSVLDHITDYLKKPRLGDSKQPSFWPSEASAVIVKENGKEKKLGKCKRASYFRYLLASFSFYPELKHYSSFVEEIKRKSIPLDKYLYWLFNAGDLYEESIIELAKRSGVYIADQVPVYIKEANVSGKIDILTINPMTGKYIINEAKSVYGHGGRQVLGTPAERRSQIVKEPRASNLMQVGLYHYAKSMNSDRFEDSRLLYGSRDTGIYVELGINIDDNSFINYYTISPFESEQVNSKISIQNILEQYRYIQLCVDSGEIPKRDYDLLYSEEKLHEIYLDGEMTNKSEKERYEKYLDWKEGKRNRKSTPPQKGDWQCSKCQYKELCYVSTDKKHDDYGKPTEL